MRIFDTKSNAWESKINFVDDNNVFVGYDLSQDCCEHAGWFIAKEITPYNYDIDEQKESHDVKDYNFDKAFFMEVPSGELDSGKMIAFKLVADGKPDLYLHLFNAQNGDYSHGFEVKFDDKVIHDDYL